MLPEQKTASLSHSDIQDGINSVNSSDLSSSIDLNSPNQEFQSYSAHDSQGESNLDVTGIGELSSESQEPLHVNVTIANQTHNYPNSSNLLTTCSLFTPLSPNVNMPTYVSPRIPDIPTNQPHNDYYYSRPSQPICHSTPLCQQFPVKTKGGQYEGINVYSQHTPQAHTMTTNSQYRHQVSHQLGGYASYSSTVSSWQRMSPSQVHNYHHSHYYKDNPNHVYYDQYQNLGLAFHGQHPPLASPAACRSPVNNNMLPSNTNQSIVQSMDNERLMKRARRQRTSFTKNQLDALEKIFLSERYPDVYRREEISSELSLKEEVVRVWFKNRRAKAKRESKDKISMCSPTSPVSPVLGPGNVPPALYPPRTTEPNMYYPPMYTRSEAIPSSKAQYHYDHTRTDSSELGLCKVEQSSN